MSILSTKQNYYQCLIQLLKLNLTCPNTTQRTVKCCLNISHRHSTPNKVCIGNEVKQYCVTNLLFSVMSPLLSILTLLIPTSSICYKSLSLTKRCYNRYCFTMIFILISYYGLMNFPRHYDISTYHLPWESRSRFRVFSLHTSVLFNELTPIQQKKHITH